jgi:hypothetical protein
MAMHYSAEGRAALKELEVQVPARRLKVVYMDDVAPRKGFYGVRFSSNEPVATQWLRQVMWNQGDEVMAFWSVPCRPGPLE